MECSQNELFKISDLSNIVSSNIKVKEFYETRDTIDKAMPIIKKFYGTRKLRTIYEFTAGHTFSGLYALARNHCNNVVSLDLHFPKSTLSIQSKYSKLMARLETREEDIYQNEYQIPTYSTVLSIHPCRNLSYRVCDIAIENNSPIILEPCCTPKGYPSYLDTFEINKHLKHELKLANYLSSAGYDIRIKKITSKATPRNTIIIGTPNI